MTQGIYRPFLGPKWMHNYQDFAISAVHDFQEKQLNKRREQYSNFNSVVSLIIQNNDNN